MDRAHMITLEKYAEAVFMHSQLQASYEQLQAEIRELKSELKRLKEAKADAPEGD